MPHLSTILESFTNSSILFCYPQRHLQWSTMPTMSSGHCPPYPAAFYPDARKMWSSTWIFSLCLAFRASTKEEKLLQGKIIFHEGRGGWTRSMVCPICCRALTTEHCLRLDYCIHWRLSYYSQRGDTLQAALLTIELLSTTRFETRVLSLSTCLLQPFIGGSKHCSILVSRPKKHSIENLRTKSPLQPPHFTQLKFSHLCLVPQCAILWYPKAPVTIQLW